MIRESRLYVSRLLCAVALATLLFLVALPSLARAGDDDGVQGYSMKLKNKITTYEGPGGNGLVLSDDTAEHGVGMPQVWQTEVTVATRIWLAIFAEPRTWSLWFIR